MSQSFSQNLEDFMEESVIELYRQDTIEVQQAFLIKSLKPDVSVDNVPFPLDIYFFNESPNVFFLYCVNF